MSPYGADPATWNYWDVALGLGADLLPVVCQPGLAIAPSSALTSYGKVPSRFDSHGRVVGFPQWTQHVASDADLARWSADSRLGICLQTRSVRALDVDIEDFDQAQTVYDLIRDWCTQHRGRLLPCRIRSNSSKFLCLFELAGTYPKQVLHTSHGLIELLMNGQQCLVAGSHPSGVPYTWDGGLGTVEIPSFTLDEFVQLKAMLAEALGVSWTEGKVRKARDAGVVLDVEDDVVRYLRAESPSRCTAIHADRIDVHCPWASAHTSETDASSTSYFPAGTGGYEQGAFRCLHAHCLGRTTQDFLDAIGWTLDGFENVVSEVSAGEPTSAEVLAALTASVPLGQVGLISPVDGPRYVRLPKTGKIKPHLNNFLMWLNHRASRGLGVSFDVFRDEYVLDTDQGRRDFVEQDYTRLQSLAEKGMDGFDPLSRQLVRDAVRVDAQEHCFDSAKLWLASLEVWDGRPRVDTFCTRCFGSPDDPHSRAVGRYLWTAMPGRIASPGIQADMTLILVSKQGTRKSSAIRAIAPLPEYFTEVSFADGEADLARLTKGKTLVEIPELKGLRSRDIEWIKAFVTKRENSWVPKYFEMKTTYARRFLMIGTTNEQEFLADPTGERRWLPLTVTQIQDRLIRDEHTQLWAEGYHLYREQGILWKDAQESAALRHHEYTIHDAMIDKLSDWLYQVDSITKEAPATRPFLRILDIWREIYPGSSGVPNKADQMRIAEALSRIGYTRATVWLEGRVQKVWKRNLATSEEFF